MRTKWTTSRSLLFVAATSLLASSTNLVTAAPSSTAEVREVEQSIDAGPKVPSLKVPPCPQKGSITYTNIVPSTTTNNNQYNNEPKFPKTQVDLCYDKSAIQIVFTAFEEPYFFFNQTYKTNDPIYQYEVMETFIARSTNDPSTYLEFEVAPNNVTFNAFIYNPSKTRATGQPFDTFFIQTPQIDGLTAKTTIDRPGRKWTSSVRIPLALFNVDNNKAKGTRWRMNFFRTVVDPKTFPDQLLGAWSPPDQPNFHITPYFGNVEFV